MDLSIGQHPSDRKTKIASIFNSQTQEVPFHICTHWCQDFSSALILGIQLRVLFARFGKLGMSILMIDTTLTNINIGT